MQHFIKTPDKKKGLDFLCEKYNITPDEVLFVFDDVLDLAVAELAGVRFMVGRSDNILFRKFAVDNNLVDYITMNNGRDHAVREVSELVMILQNNFNETIENRMHFFGRLQNLSSIKKYNIATIFYHKRFADNRRH